MRIRRKVWLSKPPGMLGASEQAADVATVTTLCQSISDMGYQTLHTLNCGSISPTNALNSRRSLGCPRALYPPLRNSSSAEHRNRRGGSKSPAVHSEFQKHFERA